MNPPSTEQCDRVLDRLRIIGAAQAIRDADLNHALAPFRGHPPIALMCGNANCPAPLLWCALDPTTARVRFSAIGPAAAGAPGSTGPPPYDRWQATQDAGEVIANPGDPLLRWRFRCVRCDRACVLSNGRMITLIVWTLAAGETSITPSLA